MSKNHSKLSTMPAVNFVTMEAQVFKNCLKISTTLGVNSKI